MRLSKIEDTPSDGLKFSNQLVKLGGLVVELLHARSQAADIRDAIRVLLQDVANRIERVPGRGVELGGFDQVGGDFERDRPSHNRPYVNRRPELRGFSGRRST